MRRRDWGTKLCLRGRERVERPDADLRGTDSHRRQSGHFASIGAELHIVMEILGFVPLLNKHEVVGIEIAPEESDVSEAFVSLVSGNIPRRVSTNSLASSGLIIQATVTVMPLG